MIEHFDHFCEDFRGYVANITETCDPENEIQLITSASVEPNTTDDQKLLETDIKELKSRMDIDELVTDAGYTGPTAASVLESEKIKQTTTAIKGRKKQKNSFGLDDFQIHRTQDGTIIFLECPKGKNGQVKQARKAGRHSTSLGIK